jgi:resuscitation-promoting factor RpfB
LKVSPSRMGRWLFKVILANLGDDMRPFGLFSGVGRIWGIRQGYTSLFLHTQRSTPVKPKKLDMRLYHLHFCTWMIGSLLFLSAGCSPPQTTQALIQVSINADGQIVKQQLPAGSTVQQALQDANLTLGNLDDVQPPAYTLLNNGAEINVIRVREEFEVQQETIPFEKLRQPTEYLPEGQLQLDPIQKGEPGLREVTYRVRYENGKEVSRKIFKSEVVKEPVPQVVLVGVQPLVTHFDIPGRLAYLFNGDAWLLEGKTSNRRPVITTGDLDGRVFTLSADGTWLLYTRRSKDKDQINELWAADISGDTAKEVNLGVNNIVHFADWIPGSDSKIVFSTVEPRTTAPGWQANNDLYALTFSPSGWVSSNWKEKPVLEANSGGIYGWWGMGFIWSPDGKQLAYARPDGIGLLDFEKGTLTTTLSIVPLQTGGDWAWVPGLTWGADGSVLFTENHIPQEGSGSPEESPIFNLTAISLNGGDPIDLVPQTGMFGYPIASPVMSGTLDGEAYQVAYLQAIFPTQSENSRYRLVVMDRDGSNRKILFPEEGKPGLKPQQVVWSPTLLKEQDSYAIAVLYEDNLWLVDAKNGEAHQITGEGLVSRISWR